MDSLEKRGELLSLRIAKNCLRNEKLKERNIRKYETKQINTKRFESSALPYMTNLLNKDEENKRKMMKNI